MNKHPYILAGTLALAFAFFSAASAQVCFTDAPVPGYALGRWHSDIAVADMTGDGFPDLVTTDIEDNTVTIMRWDGVDVNGQPVYALAGSFTVEDTPTKLAVADFNGDNHMDIAVTCFNADKVVVLINDGSGGMSSTAYNVGSKPAGIACADFNGDGKPDLMIANEVSRSISRLFGMSNGQFTALAPVNVGGNDPFALMAGDFNGDGKQDLVMTLRGWYGYYQFAQGDGYGGLTMQGEIPTNNGLTNAWLISDIDTADFNHDGVTDFALNFIESNGRRIYVVKGVAGGFPTNLLPISFPGLQYNTDVACGDFNCDGNPDIAVLFQYSSNNNRDSIKIILGRGDGSFGQSKHYGALQSVATALTVYDFNNDGKQDIVTANNVNPNGQFNFDIYLLLNKTNCITVTGDSTYCQAGQVTLTASSNGAQVFNWSAGFNTGTGDTFGFSPTVVTTNYSVTANDGMGCITTHYGNVIMAPVNAGAQLAGDSLTASPAGLSYQWLDCASDTPIPGATARVFYPVIAGNYRVIVTNPYGCADTSACSFLPLSTEPGSLDGAGFRLYPNPAQGVFYIDADGASRVVVHDLTGRAVHELAVKEKGTVAVRADLPPGVYVVRVVTAAGQRMQKIVIQ